MPSTVKFALAPVAPLILTRPTVFSLVVSAWPSGSAVEVVRLTPGSVTIMPNRSRPFNVIFANWLWSISFEFSLEAVCVGVATAVTDTCSVIAPNDRLILPKSRTSSAVTEILDC